MRIAIIFGLSLLVAAALAQNSDCTRKRLDDLMSGRKKPKGANLGAWLVLEDWMDNSAWNAAGCNAHDNPGSTLLEQCLNSRGRREQVIKDYWKRFITWNDFRTMSSAGINFVRLPVGWWHIYDQWGGSAVAKLNNTVSPRDYQTGGLAVIDQAFSWAQEFGMGVLISMHAAPGSQGGTDNSAPPDKSGNFYWDKYNENQLATVDSVSLYAQRYAKHPAFWGIGLLNEPRGSIPALQNYYYKAYAAVRRFTQKAIVVNPLIVPFQFGTEGEWRGFMQGNFQNVWYDLHMYSCFGGAADQDNAPGAINYVNWDRLFQIKAFYGAQPGKKLLIGEWSGCNNFRDNNVVGFVNAQMNTYNNADGWSFWSWTGSGGGWKFADMLNRGIDRNQLNNGC